MRDAIQRILRKYLKTQQRGGYADGGRTARELWGKIVSAASPGEMEEIKKRGIRQPFGFSNRSRSRKEELLKLKLSPKRRPVCQEKKQEPARRRAKRQQ